MTLTEGDRLRIHEKARAALQAARRSRYPVVLVLAQGDEAAPALWSDFAQSSGLQVLDLLLVAQNGGLVQAFSAWPVFVEWLREQAVSACGILLLGLDEVATRWGEESRRRLFWKLLRSEPRTQDGSPAPIVAVSALAMQFDLPTDTRSYGHVLELHD